MTQNLNHQMPAPINEAWAQDLEIFEIKQLADKEALYRRICRDAIKNYRSWQHMQSDQTDMIELLYGRMEGNMHRSQMKESIKMYWAIRKHFRIAYARYLEKTGCYPASYETQYKTN